jgi:hypothetical protein
MDATTFAQVAKMVAAFGAIGLAVGALNIFALRAIRLEEVPGVKRGRVRWWYTHNPAFLLGSAVLAVAGLAMLVTA